MLDGYFGIRDAGSTVSTEVRAGVTTFLTMAYILFVNPSILGAAIVVDGVDVGPQLLVATALAAALGSLVMGLWARYPFALAPGMGTNAYFAYAVVIGLGIAWQTALGAVFVSGVVFLALSLVGARQWLVDAIPRSLRLAIAAGIGLFLAFLGLQSAGIVVNHDVTLVTMGDARAPAALLAVGTLVVTAALQARGVRGALAIGIVGASALAVVAGLPVYRGEAFGGFDHGIAALPRWPSDIAGALDIGGALSRGLLEVVFVFLFVDLFDTSGTFVALSESSGLTDEDGSLARARPAFAADAIATIAGALFGTSTTTSYIESAAGIDEGGRTGLTAVVVAALFVVAMFFWPLLSAVPAAATAPALIVVGAMMMGPAARIAWGDVAESVPALVCLFAIPATFSIANGIALGVLTHVAIATLAGRVRSIPPALWVIAALFAARYAWLAAG